MRHQINSVLHWKDDIDSHIKHLPTNASGFACNGTRARYLFIPAVTQMNLPMTFANGKFFP